MASKLDEVAATESNEFGRTIVIRIIYLDQATCSFLVASRCYDITSWMRGTSVCVTGKLSLSCARLTADG